MGSGFSKKHRPSSNSRLKENHKSNVTNVNKRSPLANTRSISYPSYLASIQNQLSSTHFKNSTSLEESENENISSSKPAPMVQRHSEPNMIPNSLPAKKNLDPLKEKTLPNGDCDCLTSVPLPSKVDANGSIIKEQFSLSMQELYNILTAETWLRQPALLENSYLLLVDCRKEEEFIASHIITARHHTCLQSEFGCLVDVPGQLQSFNMVVVYDDQGGKVFSSLQDKHSHVYKLNLSFERFQERFPFLCTEKLINTLEKRTSNLKTWPSEILFGELYQGNVSHALDEAVINALGITHIVNITLDQPNAFSQSIKYMRIRLDDEADVDLLSWLDETTAFIEEALAPNRSSVSTAKKNCVLVHCNFGRSRSSTIVLGYLMKAKRWSFQDSCDWLKDCRPTVKPNIGFINQLLNYEKSLFGKQLTDFHQIPF